MAGYPSDLRYTKDHGWVRNERNGGLTVGITDYAQKQLGDVVFVELPKPDAKLDDDEPFGSVESVKAVSELFAPVAGTVIAINDEIDGSPELVNQDCYGEGWLITLRPSDAKAYDKLMTAAQYEKYVAAEPD